MFEFDPVPQQNAKKTPDSHRSLVIPNTTVHVKKIGTLDHVCKNTKVARKNGGAGRGKFPCIARYSFKDFLGDVTAMFLDTFGKKSATRLGMRCLGVVGQSVFGLQYLSGSVVSSTTQQLLRSYCGSRPDLCPQDAHELNFEARSIVDGRELTMHHGDEFVFCRKDELAIGRSRKPEC